MASNVFNPDKTYRLPLWGHGFLGFPEAWEPSMKGSFAADTVETSGEFDGDVKEWAVFTAVPDDNQPQRWAGTYRIPMSVLRETPPLEIES